MEKQAMPPVWEEIINSAGGLPMVVASVQKVVDDSYYVEKVSVHQNFELVFVVEAQSAYFEISGQKVFVATNDVLLIKPGTPHKLDVSGHDTCRFLVMKFMFSKKAVAGVSMVSIEDFLSFVQSGDLGGYIRLKSAHRSEIVSAMQKIISENKKGDEHSEFLRSVLTLEIFVWLSRSLKEEWEAAVSKKGEKLAELMHTARAYIEQNFSQDISLDDIANYIYLSTSHFARAFKKAFGTSPIQYLLSLRVEKAKELLENSDLRIGEISLEVGFSSQQRFNDIFKKQAGASPSEYRAAYRKSLLNQ